MRVSPRELVSAFFYVILILWIVILSHMVLGVQADRIRLVQLVSIGMYRDDVVQRLGEPRSVMTQSPLTVGDGEVLYYSSWGRSSQDFHVVLDSSGRVVSVYYPLWDRGLWNGIRIPPSISGETSDARN